jgi:hypothetical protein
VDQNTTQHREMQASTDTQAHLHRSSRESGWAFECDNSVLDDRFAFHKGNIIVAFSDRPHKRASADYC